jgi:(p)ppGpp synthase/HD superfamily hydrolase
MTDLLTDRFGEALAFAERAHRSQTRKGTTIPYVAHLLAVAALVLEYGGDEDQAVAALLHDVVEDQGGSAMAAEVRSRFDDRIADIVLACGDADAIPKPPWRERKQAYLASVPRKSPDAILVTMADKLHNVTTIIEDHREVGDAVWSRFTGGCDSTLWYYRSLADALAERQPGPLADRLRRTVAALEASAASAWQEWAAEAPLESSSGD